jgi:hypothetical protein
VPADRSDGAGHAGTYQLPAGSYRRLLLRKCEQRAKIKHIVNNPAASVLVDDWQAAAIRREQAKRLAADEAAETFAELLGEPIVVAQWEARHGRSMPGMPTWLTSSHGGASQIRVDPDDVCEPAVYRGERNGAGFEQIRVEPRHRVTSVRRDSDR